ncbi:DUF1659 domain-containing protein [Thermohalobacter berrensis]|uniref:DUF1659 domain-containing protein n=1 Tax=Thermohalobacter berrensis TaxID=99594 RepID=A0A419T439_9FIRM|nr:DUF1659 domain-containing protein [Thermohalobacter berrensis]RKD32320.1 hypothetical protein BET03_03150 [Thermohalobacter berrensis]
MAVTSTVQSSKLRIQLDGGVDGDGKQIIKSKTYSKVKTTATNDDIYNVATNLAGLQTYPVYAVKRIDEVELTESTQV